MKKIKETLWYPSPGSLARASVPRWERDAPEWKINDRGCPEAASVVFQV
jgi:hypothetical protein